jgi:hypothetical protein
MVTAQHDEVLVPEYENYSYTRSGVLRRIAGGSGAEIGVKKTNRHSRQTNYTLFKGDGSPGRHFSKVALMQKVFGDPRHLHTTTKGQEVHNAKLTDSKVIKIRRLAARGWSGREIADEIGGISKSAVRQAVARITWRHI